MLHVIFNGKTRSIRTFSDVEPSDVVQIVQKAHQQHPLLRLKRKEEVRKVPVGVDNEVVPAEEAVVEA